MSWVKTTSINEDELPALAETASAAGVAVLCLREDFHEASGGSKDSANMKSFLVVFRLRESIKGAATDQWTHFAMCPKVRL